MVNLQRQRYGIILAAHRVRGAFFPGYTKSNDRQRVVPFVERNKATRLSIVAEESRELKEDYTGTGPTPLRRMYSDKIPSVVNCSVEVVDNATETFPTATTQNETMFRHKLKSLVYLLSSTDMDQNRLAIQRLQLLTKSKHKEENGFSQRAEMANTIVFGGNGKNGELLRKLLLSFLHVEIDASESSDASIEGRDDNSSSKSNHDSPRDSLWQYLRRNTLLNSQYSLDVDEMADGVLHPGGRHDGRLHGPVLRIISNALQVVLESNTIEENNRIDFTSKFWKQVVDVLVENLEAPISNEVTVHSLRALRLVNALEPATVGPLIRQCLFPYLVDLSDRRESARYPGITKDAGILLGLMNALPRQRVEI